MKRLFWILTIFLGILVYATNVWAEEPTQIVIGENIQLESEILNEDRQVFIYLPRTYERFNNTCPVLYLLDGGAHFHHVSGLVQFLATNSRIPNMIVVGLPNTNRTRDLTPTEVPDRVATGGADKLLKFMEKELFPYVEKNYRTQPFRILVGHSLGGLFTHYAYLTHNDMFDAYFSLSPWLVYNDGDLLKKAKGYLEKLPDEYRFLYTTVGNEKQIIPEIEKFNQMLEESAPKSLEWDYALMAQDDHGSVVHLSIYNGLLRLYQDWRPPFDLGKNAVTTITKHFGKLSEKFGYAVPIPENFLNRLGYIILNAEMYDQAIEVLKLNVEKYPESANVYDSLGEAYEQAGQLDLATKNYQKAIERGQELDDPNLKIYEDHLKRASEKMTAK